MLTGVNSHCNLGMTVMISVDRSFSPREIWLQNRSSHLRESVFLRQLARLIDKGGLLKKL